MVKQKAKLKNIIADRPYRRWLGRVLGPMLELGPVLVPVLVMGLMLGIGLGPVLVLVMGLGPLLGLGLGLGLGQRRALVLVLVMGPVLGLGLSLGLGLGLVLGLEPKLVLVPVLGLGLGLGLGQRRVLRQVMGLGPVLVMGLGLGLVLGLGQMMGPVLVLGLGLSLGLGLGLSLGLTKVEQHQAKKSLSNIAISLLSYYPNSVSQEYRDDLSLVMEAEYEVACRAMSTSQARWVGIKIIVYLIVDILSAYRDERFNTNRSKYS